MGKKKISVLLALLLLITAGTQVHAAAVNYSDVKSSDWFYGSLGTMSENKIISGYPDGTFRASDTLKVDQFLAMICRLTDNDVGLGEGYWAQNYIDFATGQGWLDGMNIYNYSKPINRFETARLTTKALGYTTPDTYPLNYQYYAALIDDVNNFPEKYKDDVLVNYVLGITRGYPDGTFQGYNTLTRAEGAVISHRIFDPKVRQQPLSAAKTEELKALFVDPVDPLLPLEGEVLMPGPIMMFPIPSFPMPLPMPALPLPPLVGVITENVLADAIIEISDMETDNSLAAGYSYGIFNINLLSADNDSLLIYTAKAGHSIITIDLLNMSDENGALDPDAVDFIRLICMNIDPTNGEDMTTWIIDQYKNRNLIPEEGNDVLFDETLMGISSLVHDHNVLKVTIQTDASAIDEGIDTDAGSGEGGGFM